MGTFQFNKSLPSDISRGINQLESSFHIVFEQMIYFRKELDNHTGKAAIALRIKMDDHITFLSESTSSMLYFADVTSHFVRSIKLVDEGTMACSVPVKNRAEQQFSFSQVMVEEEIRLNPAALNQATNSFQANLTNFEDILILFNSILENLLANTIFPWEEVSEVWNDAKKIVSVIIQEAILRVNNILGNSEGMIEELERLDNLIAFRMHREK